jgi:3-methyladenine DNA glycosylase AlkD
LHPGVAHKDGSKDDVTAVFTENRMNRSVTAREIQEQMRTLGSPEAALLAARYCRTGPGEYAERDVFLGLRAAVLHRLAKEHNSLPFNEVRVLLRSSIHEDRSLALLILARRAARGDKATKTQVYKLYMAHTRYINNWDLVDVSAPEVIGGYLADKSRVPLDRLASSQSLWERRISIVATHYFIRRNQFNDTIRIAERLVNDQEDLIDKAVGWMLREVGKRDQPTLEVFLRRHGRHMPRTMLRYAIERFPAETRLAYLRGTACD